MGVEGPTLGRSREGYRYHSKKNRKMPGEVWAVFFLSFPAVIGLSLLFSGLFAVGYFISAFVLMGIDSSL